MNTVIRVENLSKQYRLGEYGTGTISHDLNRWWHTIRGKEDPYLKIGDVNDRATKGTSKYAWALRDINFEVKQGEVLGIIGKNGAGKSTLLKILSRVTTPTTGSIKAKGRIASLLEVGTGFNDELTGRENIFLNGAILGMTKAEISSKFDEIVDFSGTERYIDTPVKRYSSGMRVRLAFAVAAHLEPEILIVDEVLAVGDAEFQKKAVGKLQDVSSGQGRTVLFVSHNMGAITSLCNRALVLSKGSIEFEGNVNNAIEKYLGSDTQLSLSSYSIPEPKRTDILELGISNSKGEPCLNFPSHSNINFNFRVQVEDKYKDALLALRIIDQTERIVFTSQTRLGDHSHISGVYNFQAVIPGNTLVPNFYKSFAAIHIPNKEVIRVIEDKINFQIEETGTDFFQYAGTDYGCVFVDCGWKATIIQ